MVGIGEAGRQALAQPGRDVGDGVPFHRRSTFEPGLAQRHGVGVRGGGGGQEPRQGFVGAAVLGQQGGQQVERAAALLRGLGCLPGEMQRAAAVAGAAPGNGGI
ncbi:MAG: hypothetical protein NVV74_01615 [Magnetospirillum sp.]|nr:hypothetical protein [Magnetospirillum sp.]